MNRLKAWLLRWLGAVSVSEFQQIRDEYRAVVSELKSDHDAAIKELIQELNDVRNSIPAVIQDSKRPIRVMRNFRDFRAAVEGRLEQPIRIERTS